MALQRLAAFPPPAHTGRNSPSPLHDRPPPDAPFPLFPPPPLPLTVAHPPSMSRCTDRYHDKFHPAFTFSSTLFASERSVPAFGLMETATSNCTSQPASDFASVDASSARVCNSPGANETRADSFRPGVAAVGAAAAGAEALTANSTFSSAARDTD